MKFSLLRTGLAFLAVMMFSTAGGAMDIEYQKDGTVFVVKGEKQSEGSYIFNKGGKDTIVMATLDWAPYIAEDICGQGWVQQLAAGAFLKMGYTVEVHFYPWKRAVMMVERGRNDVLFPEYFIPDTAKSDTVKGKLRTELLALSNKFQGGPLAFWKRKETRIDFDGDLKKLKGVSIGVVSGYENNPEFDRLMDEGYFDISEADSDWTNIKKLFHKRIKLIIGDPEVFQFTVRKKLSPAEARNYLDALETVYPVVAENHLYLAFSKKSGNYRKHLEKFNAELAEMKANGEIERLREKYSERAHLDQDCKH